VERTPEKYRSELRQERAKRLLALAVDTRSEAEYWEWAEEPSIALSLRVTSLRLEVLAGRLLGVLRAPN